MSSEREPAPLCLLAGAAALATVLLAALFGVFDLYDYDLGLARAAGRWILEQRAVPVANVFSAIHQDRPFVDDKWLFHVLASLLVDGLGPAPTVLLRALLLACLALVLVPLRRAPAPQQAAASLFGVLALAASSERFAFRPELFTLLFLALFGRVLARPAAPCRREVLLLVALQIAWVNLHGYFVLGPLLAAATAVGAVLDRLFHGEARGAVGRRLLLLLALLLVCFVNPYGAGLVWSPVEILLDLRANFAFYSEAIVEFARPFSYYPVLPSDLAAYRVLLALAGAALLLAHRRARLVEVLPVAMLCLMSLTLRRNVSLFAVVAAPLAARWLCVGAAALPGAVKRARRPAAFLLGVAALALALWLGFLHATGRLAVNDRLPKHFGAGMSALAHPDLEIDFLLAELPPGALFNSFSFGSYFTGRVWPGRAPFIDGNTAGYDVSFLREYARAVQGEAGLDELVAKYGITQFLLKPGHALTAMLLQDGRWAPVFLGRHACVIVARASAPDEWARRCDLKLALEEGRFAPVARTEPSTFWRRSEPIAELNRARFLQALGRFDQAASACEEAVRVNPDLYEPWFELGLARLAAGKRQEAVAAFDEAVARAEGAAEPLSERGLTKLLLGRTKEAEADLRAAVDLKEDEALTWFRLAYLCSREPERRTEAVENARAALRLDPDLAQARALLQALGAE
ncbi:MAG: tetratricopeptide repeat protein [Planctomycetes bacterium]|nr:tetratricopeptide repeat protein [Planctomycetota bacterium]